MQCAAGFQRARPAHQKRPPSQASRQPPCLAPPSPAEDDPRGCDEVVNQLGRGQRRAIPRQCKMTNESSGSVQTAARLQTGMALSVRPLAPVGFPFSSKTCQASAPPFSHPVPSVQTKSVSPLLLTASAGCFRPRADPGAAIGREPCWSFLSIREKKTWPSVSQALRTESAASTKASLLMGQVAIIHLSVTPD